MATAEIRALFDQGRRLMQGETPDLAPDPVVRMFNKRNLPEHARLRQLYAAYQSASEPKQAIEQRIAETEAELQAAYWRAQAIRKPARLDASTPLPTLDQVALLIAEERRAELLKAMVEAWREQLRGMELRRQEAVTAWEASHASWAGAIYALTGDTSIVPRGMLLMAWQPPTPYERVNLVATLAGLEA